MPDPHLQKCMKEIQKLLKRYRVGGAITLVSRTHSQFMYEFPYWSVIQLIEGPDGQPGVKMKSLREYYSNKKEQKRDQEDSLHCLLSIRDQGARTYAVFDELFELLKPHLGEVTHVPFSGFEPLDEEGNQI